MSFTLLKSAIIESKFSATKKQTINVLEQQLGKKAAQSILESYQVSQQDYDTWLDVIQGYAAEEGININRKSDFQEVAFAVLENDPAPIDFDMQEAIVNTLWVNLKAKKQHSKVEKVARAKEEEEQLKYAIGKMKKGEENEEAFSQAYRSANEENEEFDDFDELPDEFDPRDMEDDLGDRDSNWKNDYQSDEDDWYKTQDADQNDLPFTDDEFDDSDEGQEIISRGNRMSRDSELDDFDSASEEGMDNDQAIINRGRQTKKANQLNNFDAASKPKAMYAAEQEEVTDYSSPFHKGQLVTCKRDGASYRVEIPDGPGDNVGILVNNRIKMVPAKDLEAPHASEEEETQSPSNGKISFLHDVLTGEHSRDHLNQLQKKMEDEGANEWTRHHAKTPKNPHPKGSLAHKSWQRGMEKAAKEVWAPRPVVDKNTAKAKAKAKAKK